ncbi:MAG: hypothetical protein ABSG64_09605 [Solirubrobacteraceae bacterium]|jgi:hypothetical protein
MLRLTVLASRVSVTGTLTLGWALVALLPPAVAPVPAAAPSEPALTADAETLAVVAVPLAPLDAVGAAVVTLELDVVDAAVLVEGTGPADCAPPP